MSSKSSPRQQAQSVISGLFERGEEVFSVFLEELGRNPKVRAQVGKTLERAVDAKRAVDKNMQTLLSVLNVPSRADYHRVLTKIETLQGSVVNLSMKLDRLLAQQQEAARAAAPPHASAAHAAPSAAARPAAKKRTRKKA
jgi:ribosomal protein L12E/L44/L45/RPP1/RPP2